MKGQIKEEIKEDINKLGNDGFNVEVKLSSSSTRRDCLEITGIPVVPNDSPALLVKEMSEMIIYGSEPQRKRHIDRSSFPANEESERSTNCQVHLKREKRRNLQQEEKLKI